MAVKRRLFGAAVAAWLLLPAGAGPLAETVESELLRFEIEVVTDELDRPWGMAFLPGGDLLITEIAGRLRMLSGGRLLEQPIAVLPDVVQTGQGGLLGIALHPRFAANRLVYLAHAAGERRRYGTEVVRGRLEGRRLVGLETVFRALPKSGGGRHFGSRLAFGPDGSLYVSLGERGQRDAAQDLGDHRGSMIRIADDGTVPADNPFVDRPGARAEIFSYGHRNIQGLAVNPASGEIWAHEHGPQGGDEVNIIRAGANYGWPVITYGVNYVIGTKIGEGTAKPGMVQPIHKWVPSIAPSGMAFYGGDALPAWRGDLFVGSLKFGLLVRLDVDGDRIVGEERLLGNAYGRIRDVVAGPDGRLYVLSDAGLLLRLSPAVP